MLTRRASSSERSTRAALTRLRGLPRPADARSSAGGGRGSSSFQSACPLPPQPASHRVKRASEEGAPQSCRVRCG
eukprot:349818-Chlamydomonas_euryale.AAC.2